MEKKFTKVQQQVMKRLESGQRLVFIPTNRASGDAIFWVRASYKEGITKVIEKALYPQLRRLMWDGYINYKNGTILSCEGLVFEKQDFDILHAEGCIGF